MTYRLGKDSEANLIGVRPGLVLCVRRAIQITKQDFGVHEGVRNLARQIKLVAAHASRTLDSHHIPDASGFADATDNVPYVDGRLQWQMPCCNRVAIAMRQASLELKVPITWGRVWDRLLGELDPDHLEHERWLYVQRYQALHPPHLVDGGKIIEQFPLDDGPHFQGLRQVAKVKAA